MRRERWFWLVLVIILLLPTLAYAAYTAASAFDSQIRYRWVEISTTGNSTGMTAQGQQKTAPIGFEFDFFGNSYTELNISPYGYVTFGGSPYNNTNQNIPDAAEANNVIAPFWDDLNFSSGTGDTNIYFQSMGVAPKRSFVVQWNNMTHTSIGDGSYITFQLILYENTSSILFNYKDPAFTGSADEDFGGSATSGIEDSTGVGVFAITYNQKQLGPLSSTLVYNNTRCTVLQNFQNVNTNTIFCPGIYHVNTSSAGVIGYGASSVTAACDNTVLFGNNSGNAVYFSGRDYVTLEYCTIANYSSQGAWTGTGSHNITVRHNKFANCSLAGISFQSRNNTAFNNTFLTNAIGIRLVSAFNNTIINNTFFNQTSYGVTLNTAAHNNTIYGNKFKRNNGDGDQVDNDGKLNKFNKTTIGNYWTTYDEASESCYDNSAPSGICDTAYTVPGAQTAYDNYPIMYEKGGCTIPSETTYTTSTSFCPGTYRLNDTGQVGVLEVGTNNVNLTCDRTVLFGNSTGVALYLAKSNATRITGCTFNNYSKGISLATTPSLFFNITIEDSTFINNTNQGIDSVNIKLDIINSTFIVSSTYADGIKLNNGNSSRILNSTFNLFGLDEKGITLEFVENASVEGNTFNLFTSTVSGILAAPASTNSSIRSNTFNALTASTRGVTIESANNLLRSNVFNVNGTSAVGINMTSFNNTIYNNTINVIKSGRGIELGIASDFNNITENTINTYANASYGIVSTLGISNTIENNVFYTNGSDSVNLAVGADLNIIRNNNFTIERNGSFGVFLSSMNNTVKSNIITHNASLSAGIGTISSNNLIASNTVNTYRENSFGLAITLGKIPTVENNTLRGNSVNVYETIANNNLYGIQLQDVSNNNVNSNQIYLDGLTYGRALAFTPGTTNNNYNSNEITGGSNWLIDYIQVPPAATPPTTNNLTNTTFIIPDGPNNNLITLTVTNKTYKLINTTIQTNSTIFFPSLNLANGTLSSSDLILHNELVAMNVSANNITRAMNTTANITLVANVDCTNFSLYYVPTYNRTLNFNITANIIATQDRVGESCLNNQCTNLACDASEGDLTFVVSGFSSYGALNGSEVNPPVTTDNHSATYGGIAASWYWFDDSMGIQLNATSVARLNYTRWCGYVLGANPCTNWKTENATEFNYLTNISLSCSSTLCQNYIRYHSANNNTDIEQNRTSFLINIKNGVDIQNASLKGTTASSGCYIRNSVINNSNLYHNATYKYNCRVEDSTVLDSTLTGSIIKNSFIDPTTIIESKVIDSNITNSTVKYSDVVNATFCGPFNVSGAYIERDILHSGSIKFNGSTYYAPSNLTLICQGLAPTLKGSMVAIPSIFTNLTNVNFTYYGEGLGFTVTLNTSPLNDSVLSLTDSNDDGTYKTNFTFGDGLANGVHRLNGTVNDNVGNFWNISVNVTVDTIKPNLTITLAGGAINVATNFVTLNMSFTDNTAVSKCRYGINVGNYSDWLDCEATKTVDLTLGDGTKTYQVQIKDTAGNTQTSTDTISLDTTPPAAPTGLTITTQPIDTDGTVNLSWASATGVSHYNLYRSQTAYFNISSGTLIKNATTNSTSDAPIDGTYYYKVTSVDAVGWESPPSAQVNTTVDTQASLGSLTANVSVVRNQTNLTFTYSAYETGLTVTVNTTQIHTSVARVTLYDSDSNGIYTNTFVVDSSATGSKLVELRSSDGSNVYRENLSIYVDNTNPSGNITLFPSAVFGLNQTNQSVTHSRSIILNLTYSDNYGVNKCAYSNDGSTFTQYESCSESKAWILSSGNGLKTVHYRIKDLAGNNYTTNASITLDISGEGLDLTAPNVPLVYDSGSYTRKNNTLYIYWTNASDPEAEQLNYNLQYEYRIYNLTNSKFVTDWTSAGTSTNVNITGLNLAEGKNFSVYVRVLNSANLTANASSDGIVIDTTAPTLTINSTSHLTESSYYALTTANFTLTGTDATSGIQGFSYMIGASNGTGPDFSLEPTPIKTLVSPRSSSNYSVLANGTYFRTFYQHVNKSSVSSGDTVSVEFSLSEFKEDTIDRMKFQVYVCNDTSYNCSRYISNIESFSRDVPFASDLTSATRYTVDLTINDSSDSYYVGIKPINATTNALIMPVSGSNLDGLLVNEITPGGAGSGTTLRDYDISVKKTMPANPQNISYSNLADGIYFLHVRALDKANNWGNPFHYRFMVDATGAPPAITSKTPRGFSLSSTPILRVTTDEAAVCQYSDDGENFTAFDRTGLTVHKQQLSLSEATYNYSFNCSDVGGRYNDTEYVDFTIDLDAKPDALTILNRSGSIFKSQEITYNVNVSKSGYPLIGFRDFNLTIGSDGKFYELVDRQSGIYNFTFTAPNATGSYTLTITGGPASDTETLTVAGLELTVTYSLATNTKTNLVYGKTSGTYVGFGCDQTGETCAVSSQQVASSGHENTFVFFSNKLKDITKTDTQLGNGRFMASDSHKIGTTYVDDYLIKTMLDYDYIILQGNESTDTGRYTLVLKNEGKNASGVPIISLDIK